MHSKVVPSGNAALCILNSTLTSPLGRDKTINRDLEVGKRLAFIYFLLFSLSEEKLIYVVQKDSDCIVNRQNRVSIKETRLCMQCCLGG